MKKKDERRQAERKPSRARRALLIAALLLALGVVGYAALVGHVVYMETHVQEPSDYDSLIVLGAQVLPDATPSVQLAWRLDTALAMYRQQPCPVVVCGAMAGLEPIPEAYAMRDYLLANGVEERQILTDAESRNTRENMENAKELLLAVGCEKPLIVTSDYHLPRALAIARDAGLTPQGKGSPCRPEVQFWLKNHMREALAWGKYWLNKYLGLNL